MRTLPLAALALLVPLATSVPLHAQESPGEKLPVVTQVLPNGMTFLLLRREDAPTVAFVTHFRAGGVDEWTGISGTAHLFEHMLFKGTRTIGTKNYDAEQALFPRIDAAADSVTAEFRKGALTDSAQLKRLRDRLKQLEDSARQYTVSNELWRILTENGAQNLNASTGNDLTNYFFSLPANRAKLWFVLESDRIRNPVLREFYSEREVVMEERRLSIETQPFGMLYEQFVATAFQAHPYGRPVVGVASEIQAVNRHAALEYYHRFYAPNNAVVAIVGDIAVDSMKAWASQYFADIPAGEPHRPVVTQEPPQRGERRIEVQFDANPIVMIGYHVPSAQHADAPALAVLSQIVTAWRRPSARSWHRASCTRANSRSRGCPSRPTRPGKSNRRCTTSSSASSASRPRPSSCSGSAIRSTRRPTSGCSRTSASPSSCRAARRCGPTGGGRSTIRGRRRG